jgi:hypothetical protein
MTPTSLRSSSRSTTRWAASFAMSSLVTFSSPVVIAIEPDRSIDRTTARLGISSFCFTSMVTGRASSIGVR